MGDNWDFKISCILLLVIGCAYQFSFAQSVSKMTLYFDAEKTRVKEISEYYQKGDKKILHGRYEIFFENGKPKAKGFYYNNKVSGKWKYFFESGNLQMEGEYVEGSPSNEWNYYYESGVLAQSGRLEQGKKTGAWITNYENGKTKTIGYYQKDIPEGVWHFFNEDGSIKARAVYEEGRAEYTEYFPDKSVKSKGYLKSGVSDSLWVYFHQNGNIKATGMEKNGLREGLWYFYHENGNLAAKGGYENGKTKGMWTYYYENGQMSGEGIENDGEKDGYWKLYYETGNFKAEGKFNNGSGEYKEYYENGKLKIVGQLLKGKNNGTWKYYYEDGNEEGVCEFVNGEGNYLGYYPNGKLKMEGTIVNGEKSGTWKLYNEDGDLVGFYKNYNDPLAENIINPSKYQYKDTVDFEKLANPKWKTSKTNSDPSATDWLLSLLKNNQLRVIPAFNPLALIVQQLPIYLEFLHKKKRGYELLYTYYGNPFFEKHKPMKLNMTYSKGHFIGFKYKLYSKITDNKEMRYFAGELRYKTITNNSEIIDSFGYNSAEQKKKLLRVNENAIETALLFGDRLMKNYNKSSLTVDLFIGIGVGYRFLNKNFEPIKEYDDKFDKINTTDWYVPIRVGFSLGYAF